MSCLHKARWKEEAMTSARAKVEIQDNGTRRATSILLRCLLKSFGPEKDSIFCLDEARPESERFWFGMGSE